MSLHETDRRHLERQIVYARPIVVLLSILALLEQPNPQAARRSISFLVAYLILSLANIPLERFLRKRSWHLPIACDLLALGFFMYISPLSVPVWFPYLFVCWVAGMRWGLRAAIPLAGALALILVLLTAVKGEIGWMRVIAWVGLVGGTFAGGAALAFLADPHPPLPLAKRLLLPHHRHSSGRPGPCRVSPSAPRRTSPRFPR